MPFWRNNKSFPVPPLDGGDSKLLVGQASTSNEAPDSDDKPMDEVRLGMFILEDKPSDASANVDIVAIHGLNGHYQRTWSAIASNGSQVNWLRDFLPKQIPNARIMSYGYNSAVQFSKSVAAIETFAKQLLEDLISWRNSVAEQNRPIIFICHSLGGIVFKQALNKAHERARFADLIEHIRGVAFFGTPHRGADLARWGSIFANILKAASFGSSTNTKLSRDLESRSEMLRQISRSFVERGKELTIFSFYETDKLHFLNCRVVDEDSAILGWSNETSIPINGDHRSICQFATADDPRYRNVWVNLQKMVKAINNKELTAEESAYLASLRTCDYESHRRRNPSPVSGTCVWFLNHLKYQKWRQRQESSILWVSANPECGKSVLSSFLIDVIGREERTTPISLCYFFFKDDNREQGSATSALLALLHQIYTSQPSLLRHFVCRISSGNIDSTKRFQPLWSVFRATVMDPGSNDTICIIDGLDECDRASRREFAVALAETFKQDGDLSKNRPFVKMLITSRPDNTIQNNLSRLPDIRLRGEDEAEAISQDVERVVHASMDDLESAGLPREILLDLQEQLVKGADMTFLWTTLMIDLLKGAAEAGASKKDLDMIIQSRDIDEIYSHLLEGTTKRKETFRMLRLVVAAARPLSLQEMSIAMEIRHEEVTRSDISQAMKHPFENYVKSLCGNFLRIIHGKVYLVHQTARRFLLKHKTKRSLATTAKQKTGSLNSNNPRALHSLVWQNSIKLNSAQFFLLKICVKYIRMVGAEIAELRRRDPNLDPEQLEEQLADLGFFDYAAKYWPLHRRQIGNAGLSWELWRSYENLCDPDDDAYEAWVRKHPSYIVNFPGRMYIPGIQNETKIETLEFFGLDEAHLRGRFPGASESSDEGESAIEELRSQSEDDDGELEYAALDEEIKSVQALPTSKKGNVPDRFLHYRRMRKRELAKEIELVGMRAPPRSHSFPEGRKADGTSILILDKTKSNWV